MALRTAAALSLALLGSVQPANFSAAPALSVAVDATGGYSVSLDGALWFQSSAAPTVCVAGNASVQLSFVSSAPASGGDAFGAWTGLASSWASQAPAAAATFTFKSYAASPSIAVLTASFPDGLDTSNCGSNKQQSTSFPAFDTSAGLAPSLAFLQSRGQVLSTTATSKGLAALGATACLDCGPVTASDGTPQGSSLVWSSLTSHKIIVQDTSTPPQPPTPGPITALWSAERNDQIACLSDVCNSDQQPQGNYVTQRVEGYGLQTGSFARCTRDSSGAVAISIGGAAATAVPMIFSYSATHVDNWVGTNASGPDATYSFTAANGFILADAGTAGTVPLQVFVRVYDASHTDYAAVASPAGLAWAAANSYTLRYTAGYVWSSPPPAALLATVRALGCDVEAEGAGADGAAPTAVYSLGVSAAVPALPAGWSYSVLLSAAYGGPTAAVYAWGEAIRGYYNTTRSPSVTLSDIGYYTDDGAYYYVWEQWNCSARPWPAEQGLLLVKEALWAQGVPVAYMQLDDWWYTGKFFFGNVKSITDWHASNASRLFPSGLPAFSDKLGLSLQLYAPFWADDFATPYNTTESTVFKGTKLVTPDDSYRFFADFFDLGAAQTNGRFATFEIDFLDSNFQGSASMFEDVGAADRWYAGMADAALERGIALQYCLPSATDMLQSLTLPAAVQARASGDYVGEVDNPFQIGGSALLMGAVHIAPSKDTLWTASPQPPTCSDTKNSGYVEQPHVVLDAVLTTLSLGPVGISDGLGQTDAALISQAFRSPTDGTLLRPSRPVSWVDSVFFNRSFGLPDSDVRSTHASVPAARPPPASATSAAAAAAADGPVSTSHYVLSWRTAADVTLAPSDLYPPPPPGAALAMRQHVFAPVGAAQQAGCVDGQPAVPACVRIVPAGAAPVIPAAGAGLGNTSLWALHEPLSNGAYFLGELAKFVHASPQRFDYVLASGAGLAGIVAGVRGSAGQTVVLTAVDPAGVARVVAAVLPAGGFAEVAL